MTLILLKLPQPLSRTERQWQQTLALHFPQQPEDSATGTAVFIAARAGTKDRGLTVKE